LRAQRSAPFSGKTRTPERAEERLAKKGGIEYIAGGSAKLTGGAPGLQIRCRGVKAFLGGFYSHALPPSYRDSPLWRAFCLLEELPSAMGVATLYGQAFQIK